MNRRLWALLGACTLVGALLVPAIANARTKTVWADAPPSAQKRLQKYAASVNAFFQTRVVVNVGDSVKFRINGFHDIDLPGASGKPLPFIVPSGSLVSGITDAAGNSFWFNGKVPALTFNLQVLAPSGPKSYNGSKRILSGLPTGPPKPLTIRFTKAGTYKYFCDIHPGMIGTVVVKPAGKKVPTTHQDSLSVKAQVDQAVKTAKKLSTIHPKPNQVSLGSAAGNGVEDFAMFPAKLTVAPGTTVTFFMSAHSREVHTATFGPIPYLTNLANKFDAGGPETQQSAYPSDNPAAGVPVLTPTSHGNGFVNTGTLDRDAQTVTIPSSGRIQFTTPGTYSYICVVHPFMVGTIVVQ